MIVYNFDTVFNDGRVKNKTVRELFEKNNGFVFETIKKWAINGISDKKFSDDVLEAANIKKKVTEHDAYQEDVIVTRTISSGKKDKKLKKENKSVAEILNEIDDTIYYVKDFNDKEEKEVIEDITVEKDVK